MTAGQGAAAGLEAELDTLYRAPLEEFVARRDALVKGLRAAGAADDWQRVKALRKPTAVAWAINRLHLERRGLAEIEEASEALRRALRDPRSAEERRSAIEARRRALERATAAVVVLLEEAGSAVSPALLRRIERTLLAVASGAGAAGAGAPTPGRLDQELEPPGFEAILDLPTPALVKATTKPDVRIRPAPPPTKPGLPAKGASPARPAASKAAPAKATAPPLSGAAAKRAAPALLRHDAAARAAQAALDQADAELERATEKVEAARMRVTEAERALVARRSEVDAARRELAAVRSRRDQARRELDRVKRG